MFLKARPALCQRMARQKVKGTGHKQPADAKTEPNFYIMPPVETRLNNDTAPLHNFGLASGPGYDAFSTQDGLAGMPPPPTAAAFAYYDYPASPGLHGAAHLLQGIASGFNSLRLPQPPVLGQPTGPDEEDDPATQRQGNQQQRQQQGGGSPFSFLRPRLDKSSGYESL